MDKKIIVWKWIFFGLMLLVNGFIIYQSCLPAVSSQSWSDAVVDMIKTITNGSIDSSTPITPSLSWGKFIRKMIGHFSLFGLDGVVTYLYFYFLDKHKSFNNRYIHIIISIAIGVLLAVVTESLQLIIPGRYGDIIDILIDVGGYLLGVAVSFFIVFLVNKHRYKKELINQQ